MPAFRCDYKVVGDLVLPNHKQDLQYNLKNDFKIIFKNGALNEEGQPIDLLVTVIGPSDSIDNAEKELRAILAKSLDMLAFATHSRYKVISPVRLVEWDAGKKERYFKVFHRMDARYPPDPEFMEEFLSTVSQIEQCDPPSFVAMALRYFRYGLLDEQPEDQHMRLWLSLEIIAENIKDRKLIPIVCPSCQSALKCNECGTEPTRVPMAKKAIEQVIYKVAGGQGNEIAKRQFETRNGLMHGRGIKSIENKVGVDMSGLVNELAYIAWNSILLSIKPKKDVQFHFGHRGGDLVNKHVVMSMLGSFSYEGDAPHPGEDEIPSVDISMHAVEEGRKL